MDVTMTPKNGSLSKGIPGGLPSTQEEAPAHVIWFESLSRGDTAIAGGKSANLGELTRAGLPVPRGFVVTAEAFRTSIKFIGPQLTELWQRIDPDQPESLATLGRLPHPRVRPHGHHWSVHWLQ